MKSIESTKKLVEEKTKEFTKKLDGRFKEHVSDEFIQAYIVREFMNIYTENFGFNYHNHPQNIAYSSAVILFEQLLECGCRTVWNGHHTAQAFAALFSEDCLKKEKND